jgi:hypothetical protein
MLSKFLSINTRDIIHGAILAAGSAVFAAVKPMIVTFLTTGSVPVFTLGSVESIIYTGLVAGILYIGKNFFSNSNGQLAVPEVKK